MKALVANWRDILNKLIESFVHFAAICFNFQSTHLTGEHFESDWGRTPLSKSKNANLFIDSCWPSTVIDFIAAVKRGLLRFIAGSKTKLGSVKLVQVSEVLAALSG